MDEDLPPTTPIIGVSFMPRLPLAKNVTDFFLALPDIDSLHDIESLPNIDCDDETDVFNNVSENLHAPQLDTMVETGPRFRLNMQRSKLILKKAS